LANGQEGFCLLKSGGHCPSRRSIVLRIMTLTLWYLRPDKAESNTGKIAKLPALDLAITSMAAAQSKVHMTYIQAKALDSQERVILLTLF